MSFQPPLPSVLDGNSTNNQYSHHNHQQNQYQTPHLQQVQQQPQQHQQQYQHLKQYQQAQPPQHYHPSQNRALSPPVVTAAHPKIKIVKGDSMVSSI